VPVVLKADGLAAGKGSSLPGIASRRSGRSPTRCATGNGAAGDRVVIEECLSGPEVSFFALCDGVRAVPIGTAQDHKRIFDDDRGPNTGGWVRSRRARWWMPPRSA
jgi:phosphoribosylamine--glycine ligase